MNTRTSTELMTFAKIARCLSALAVAMTAAPAAALDARHLAVIINANDPVSVQIGEYYAAQRRISFQNIIRVALPGDRPELTPAEFEEIKREVDRKTLRAVQVYALTWTIPFRVGCMSITSAFAFGYDPAFCEPGCKPTRPSPYFNSGAKLPFAQLRMRPTMAIAATSLEEAKALIDRGVKADGSFPQGAAYMMSTADTLRNVRHVYYPDAKRIIDGRISVFILKKHDLKYVNDVLFYFTGVSKVDGLHTLQFVPGAIADHLTSSGGILVGPNPQMSSLRWLEAGATGSYGAVVEPCNLPHKFPNPAVAAANYLRGDTLIEAYWKSVVMPGQGIFIGEPLAAPFRTKSIQN